VLDVSDNYIEVEGAKCIADEENNIGDDGVMDC
jgi:hypothetical protein